MMREKILDTAFGRIHYWGNHMDPARRTLIFLPGLTADHHLFDILRIFWIKEAGHNSNTDQPEEVNQIIREFVTSLQEALS